MSKWGKICFLASGLAILILFTVRLILGGWLGYMWIPLGIGVTAFLAALVIDYKFYFEFLALRTTKHGMNMGVMILLVFGLATAVNYLGIRFNHSVDFTKEKLNSLSDQSLQVLKDLKEDLEILIFYQGESNKDMMNQLKANYQAFLDESPKVKLRFVNAYADLETAKKYLSPSDLFTVVVQYKNRKIGVDRPYNEEQLTSGIIKVTRETEKKIAFLVGHGERDIDSDQADGTKGLAEALRRDGYVVSKVNLLGGDSLPEPSTVLAIVGPKTAFLDEELEKIRDFAKRGGRLFIAIDPNERHQLANLTKSLGVEFKNNTIANQFQGLQGTGIYNAIGLEFDSAHDITKKFAGSNNAAMFLLASEISRAPDAPTELTFHELVKTHQMAFAVATPGQVPDSPDRKVMTIGIAVKGPMAGDSPDKKDFSAVIFGDSDFISNRAVTQGLNGDLVLNSFASLADEASLISIRPKSPEATKFESTPGKEMFLVLSGAGLPLVFLVLTGVFWYRRRSL